MSVTYMNQTVDRRDFSSNGYTLIRSFETKSPISSESRHLWNIPHTNDGLKLYSGAWFEEYTQK